MPKLDLSFDEIKMIRSALLEIAFEMEAGDISARTGYSAIDYKKLFEKIDKIYVGVKENSDQ